MKSNKSYIAASIAMQMIVIPILFTLVLFTLFNVPSILEKSGLGNDAVRFMYILIASFGALLVGGVTGFVFLMLTKNKPTSAKVLHITPAIPIIYALVFAIFAIAFSNGNYNSGWWGIYVVKNPLFLVFDFFLAFSGLHFVMPVAELMGYTGFLLGVFLYNQISKVEVKRSLSVSLKSMISVLCITVITFTVISTREVISNGIIELQYGESTIGSDLTEFDLMNIAPFKKNNGLVKLDRNASLKFTEFDEMPRLDGATAVYPVYAAFVETVYKGLGDYFNAHKDDNNKDIYTAFVASSDYPLNIVKCSKTGGAYESLIDGKTDIIFVAEPSKAHNEAIKAKGDEFVLTPIGSEAFVFFTNTKNPVDKLTIKQIQDIYSGNINNWKEVGGLNKDILPYQRPENSGSQTIMQNKVMKDVKMLEQTKETYAGGMGEIISEVASYKNAKNSIGYSFMYYSSSMIKNNQIKYISVDGIKPTFETVRNKTYPFTVPVYAVTLKSNTNKNVGKFIDWILSNEGQSLVEKTGYVPVK